MLKTKRKTVIGPNRIKICPYSQTYEAWCRGCGKDTDLVTFHEAVQIVGTDLDTVIKYVAKGNIHLGIRPEALLICLNSLVEVAEFSVPALAN